MSDEWRNDFMSFYNDMKVGYKPGLQIDRIDVNGGYCKENCRWLTVTENSRNKRNTIYLNIDGTVKSMAEWAEIHKKSYAKVHERRKRCLGDKYTLFGKPKFDPKRMLL